MVNTRFSLLSNKNSYSILVCKTSLFFLDPWMPLFAPSAVFSIRGMERSGIPRIEKTALGAKRGIQGSKKRPVLQTRNEITILLLSNEKLVYDRRTLHLIFGLFAPRDFFAPSSEKGSFRYRQPFFVTATFFRYYIKN
jgi:hypothetical protein